MPVHYEDMIGRVVLVHGSTMESGGRNGRMEFGVGILDEFPIMMLEHRNNNALKFEANRVKISDFERIVLPTVETAIETLKEDGDIPALNLKYVGVVWFHTSNTRLFQLDDAVVEKMGYGTSKAIFDDLRGLPFQPSDDDDSVGNEDIHEDNYQQVRKAR